MSEMENLLKAAQARLAEKSTPYFPSLTNTSYDIVDADTIDGQRILGFDAPESVDLYREGGKAQRIEEDYGVDRNLQELLGKRATQRTEELMKDPRYQQFGAPQEIDAYGRPLVENTALKNTLIEEGLAVPSDRYDAKAQSLYRAKMEKQLKLTGTNDELDAMSSIRDYNMGYLEEKNSGWFNSLGRSVDSTQSAVVQLVGSTGDLVSDMFGYAADEAGFEGAAKYLDKWGETLKSSKYADEVTGYDRRESDFMKGEILHKLKTGDYVGAISDAWEIAPETIGESLPMMIELLVGVGGKAKVAKGVYENLPGMVNLLKRNAGYANTVARTTNDQKQEYTELHGEDPSAPKLAEMFAMNIVMLGLDRITFKALLGVKDSVKAVVDALPEKAKLKLIQKVAAGIVSGGAKEAGQEYLQTWGEILNVNAKDVGEWGEVLTNTEKQYEALLGFTLGGVSGANIQGISSVVGPEALNELRRAKQKSDVEEAIPEAAADKMSEAQKEYVDEIRGTRELDETGNISFTEEEEAIFKSKADPIVEPVTDEEMAEAEDTMFREAEDTMFREAEDIKAQMAELQTQIDATSSKDQEAKAALEVIMGNLDEQFMEKKAQIDEYILEESIQANTDKMKAEGATEQEVSKANEVLRSRGIADGMLTLEDRKAGLTLEIAKPEGVRLASESGKKQKTFESFDVKDETLKEIVEGGFTLETAKKLLGKVKNSKISERLVKHFRAESDTVAELEGLQKTINETLGTKEGREALGNLINEDSTMTEEKALRMVALALAQIKSNITSEFHVNKNAGLNPKAEHARVSDIVQQLGKDYLNSYGLKYAGSAEALAKKNSEIGQNILNFAKEAGLIDIGEAKVSALNLVYSEGKNKGESISKDGMKDYAKVAGSETNVNGKSVTMIVTDVVKLKDNTGKGGVVKSAKASASSILSKILKPTNYDVPNTEPVEEVPYNEQGEPLSENEESIIRDMNSMKFIIKPEALELFKQLKEIIYGKNGTQDFDTGSKKPEVKELLELLNVKVDVNKDKDSGRSLNKMDALRNILDNLDVIDPNNMYYNYESAINRRIHLMQTVLEFQGDKYMARNVVSGGEYTTDTDAEADLLKSVVAEELYGDASNENIDKLITDTVFNTPIKTLTTNGKLPLLYLLRLGKKVGVKNPFKLLSLVKAVADIRNGKGNKITSSYMVEVDASASGVTNTLLNRAGDPAVQAILEKMTIMGGDMDPYGIVNEGVKNPDINPDYAEDVEPVLNQFSKMYGTSKKAYAKAMRTIAKYPVMTWFYGSATTNVSVLMSEDMTKEVMENAIEGNVEAIKIVNELAGKEYDRNSIVNINNDDILAMKKYYKEKVGDIYAGSMESIFPGVNEYRADMKSIFNILKETGKWKGTLPTAMAAMEGTPTENKMSIRKRKQTATLMGESRYEQIMSEMFDNIDSMAVNPQHSTDAALLLLAMKSVMKKHGVDLGIMTVHDATYGNPKMLLDIKAEYDKLTVDMANKYDYVAAAISEAREAIGQVEKESIKKSLTAQLDKIEERNKALQESKAEFLEGKEVSVLEGAKPVKKEDTKKTEPKKKEVKSEPKVEEKKEPETEKPKYYSIGDMQVEEAQLKKDLEDTKKEKAQLQRDQQLATTYLTKAAEAQQKAVDTLLKAQETRDNEAIVNAEEDSEIATEEMLSAEDTVMEIQKSVKEAHRRIKQIEKVLKMEPEVKTKGGYVGVVFNTYGKVYDYKVEDINKYKDGDVVNSFGTTFTVKYTRETKDYPLKDGVNYKDISTITKDGIPKVSVAKEIIAVAKDIKEGNGFLGLIELVQKLDVSELNSKVKAKVIEALTAGKIDVDVRENYESEPGEIFIGLSGKDRRFSKNKKGGENFTADSLIETLGHEIDHAYNWSYIESKKGKNSAEVKYLKRVLERLLSMSTADMTSEASIRVEYIRDAMNDVKVEEGNREGNALAEMISILNNEGELAAEILQALPETMLQKVIATVKKMIQDIEAYFFDMTPEQRVAELTKDEGIRTENILLALKMLEDSTMAQSEAELQLDGAKPKGVTDSNPSQDRVLMDAYLNPSKYADGVIAKTNGWLSNMMIVFGGTALDLAAPVAREVHIKAKKKSGVYRDVTNLLYTGFITSEIAQKMRSTIGVARHINISVLNEMLSMADDINQRTKTVLTTDMTDLKNRINKAYTSEEDRVKVYKIFARSGISGIQYDKEILDGIVQGTMTIDEALRKASKDMDPESLEKAEDLAEYYVTGKSTDNVTNTHAAELFEMKHKTVVALIAMGKIDGAQDMLDSMPKDLRKDMIALTLAVQALSDEVNMRQPGFDGVLHSSRARYDIDYDGHYMKDVYNDKYEYKMVSKAEMKSSLYTSENDWIVVKEVNEDGVGVIARKRIGESRTPGIGLNTNKFGNGFHMTEDDSAQLKKKLDGMGVKKAEAYLARNNIQKDSEGNRFRFILDEKTKVEKLGMKQDAAESIMRTLAHNMELVQMQSVRDIMLDKATEKVSKDGMEKINEDVKYNYTRKRGKDSRVLPMFITIDYKYESYDSLPKWIKQEYKTPDSLSTYNGFNRKVQLVRKGEADILLGHKNFSFFGGTDARSAAKWEQGFKQIVVMAKQKMVVASASKLAVDTVSNIGVLAAKDVSLLDIKKYMPEAFSEYMDFSKKRTEIVQLEIRARMGEDGAKARLDKANEALKGHKFYQSFKHGFVQSYSTSLVTQDFDTLSGLQHNIDEIVENLTKDKKGNPNELFQAIKWWQKLGDEKGLGVDHLINWASEISKVKGTNISTEMKNMAKRLRDKKDADSVARYVGDIIGSPASELVTLGGAYMVSIDAASKYTLVQSLMDRVNPRTKKKYTTDEAYLEANETFIDYRQNMPAEIKALSDYGVLLFPSFWIKAQKVIAGLVQYHPFTTIGGYAIADILDRLSEGQLDLSSANFIDVNIVNRIADGRILNDPTNLVDWEILSPWL